MPLTIAAARAAVPLAERVAYLNAGTEGLVAAPVEDKVIAGTRLYDEEGFNSLHVLEQGVEEARAHLARWLNVDSEEVAFTDNASHSVGIVTAGLSWREGDEVLMSDEEHPALLLNFHYLQDRFGVRVVRFRSTWDEDALTAELRAKVTPRTRMIAISHVAPLTGARIPATAVTRFARDRDILSMIDGAQAVGEFAVDVAAVGADFYISNGHKWLHGPKGTGVLVIRRERLDEVKPMYLGTTAAAYPLPDGTRIVLNASARRYEFATRHLASFAGLTYALDWLEQIGLDAIEAHARDLVAYCKERVRALPGAHLHTPEAWEHSSAMVGFSIDDVDGVDLREWLRWERGIVARRVLEYRGVRLSAAYFNTREEFDRFFDMLPQYPKWPHGRPT
jgi:selenocysteine lyase/cysteine desulfurase